MQHLGKIFILFVGAVVLITMALIAQYRESANNTAPDVQKAAPEPTLTTDSPTTIEVPQFEAFPVSKFTKYTPNPDLELTLDAFPAAREYEELLAAAATSAPNFAGTYSIISWDCPSSIPACQQSAILDNTTGDIRVFGILSHAGIDYTRDSTLLIINPQESVRELPATTTPIATDYYLFENNQLTLLFKQDWDGTAIEGCPEIPVIATNSETGDSNEFENRCVVPSGWRY